MRCLMTFLLHSWVSPTACRFPSQRRIKMAIDDGARLVDGMGTSSIPGKHILCAYPAGGFGACCGVTYMARSSACDSSLYTHTGIMAGMSAEIMTMVHNFTGGLEAFRRIYWTGVGYVAPPSDSPSSAQPMLSASGSPLGVAVIAGLSVGVFVCCALLCVLALLIVGRRSNQHRTLLGKLLPPGPGPNTTLVRGAHPSARYPVIGEGGPTRRTFASRMTATSLWTHVQLVTDVQGSTQLWEAVSQGESWCGSNSSALDTLLIMDCA